MIEDEILRMRPGKNLDSLTAKEIMGWHFEILSTTFQSNEFTAPYWVNIYGKKIKAALNWSPSTDISAAWEVVEKLSSRFIVGISGVENEWSCEIVPRFREDEEYMDLIQAEAETVPETICKAALLLAESLK